MVIIYSKTTNLNVFPPSSGHKTKYTVLSVLVSTPFNLMSQSEAPRRSSKIPLPHATALKIPSHHGMAVHGRPSCIAHRASQTSLGPSTTGTVLVSSVKTDLHSRAGQTRTELASYPSTPEIVSARLTTPGIGKRLGPSKCILVSGTFGKTCACGDALEVHVAPKGTVKPGKNDSGRACFGGSGSASAGTAGA
jgi:hypothetical protein